MSNNLGNVVIDGKYIDLNSLSTEQLKEILNHISDEELTVKQELDGILKRLV